MFDMENMRQQVEFKTKQQFLDCQGAKYPVFILYLITFKL